MTSVKVKNSVILATAVAASLLVLQRARSTPCTSCLSRRPHLSPPPRPQAALPETGQRVSLNKRDKEPEAEAKQAAEPIKVQTRDYLQPREREVLRPASQLVPTQPTGQQYDVPPAHLASTTQQGKDESSSGQRATPSQVQSSFITSTSATLPLCHLASAATSGSTKVDRILFCPWPGPVQAEAWRCGGGAGEGLGRKFPRCQWHCATIVFYIR